MTCTVGGTTSGYCATGSANMATPPITIIKIASTFARTGRAMKKSEIMCRRYLAPVARGDIAAAVSSCGSTFCPGIARRMPATTTRSSGLSPLSITRRSPTLGPIVTLRWHQHLFPIGENRAHRQRPGRSVDGGSNVIERAAIRISLIGLQSDFDWILLELLWGD